MQNPQHSEQIARRWRLDALRTIAILLVVAHHFRSLAGCPEWLRWAALRGYVGVDVFFVLSGWLIGGQLCRELARTGTVRLGRFWTRRWLRTLPAYWAVLALQVALGNIEWTRSAPAVVFLQNYLAPDVWLLTWSLCIEEHFYLALPLVALALRPLARRVPGALVALVALAPIVSVCLRFVAFPRMHAGSYQGFLYEFYSPTHLRLDGLALGVGLAALHTFRPRAWAFVERHAGALAIAGALLAIGSTWNPWATGWTTQGVERQGFFASVPGFFLVGLGVAACLPWAARPVRSGSFGRACTAVAEHAYALYLTHELARQFVARFGFFGFVLELAAALALAAVCAVVLRRAVELPGLKLRDRFTLGRAGNAAVPSVTG